MTYPLVSIIIPSYNRKQELINCLSSISRQDYPAIEIIVVDDNSADNTVQTIREMYPHIEVIEGSENYGPSYRRNQGILASRGEYLLFLDSDVEIQKPSIISGMVARFQELEKIGDVSAERSRIGELGGEIAVYENETLKAFGRRISYTGYCYRVAASSLNGKLTPCDYLATCNCIVRKETALEIGGFDPYYEFGAEDADFGYSIQRHGYQNFVGFPYAVHHKASKTGRRPDETYRYRVTRIRFIIKHHGLWRTCLLSLCDLTRILAFYPLIPVKLLIKILLRKPVRRESFTGGWLILKAHIWNLSRLREILHSRTANFLSPDEMQRFKDVKRRYMEIRM